MASTSWSVGLRLKTDDSISLLVQDCGAVETREVLDHTIAFPSHASAKLRRAGVISKPPRASRVPSAGAGC